MPEPSFAISYPDGQAGSGVGSGFGCTPSSAGGSDGSNIACTILGISNMLPPYIRRLTISYMA
jgi:hypothetical protein